MSRECHVILLAYIILTDTQNCWGDVIAPFGPHLELVASLQFGRAVGEDAPYEGYHVIGVVGKWKYAEDGT